jgi:hypothetical protein
MINGNRQQQLEQEVRDLKEQVRKLTPQDSPTVRMEKTAHGFMAHADPAAPAAAEETPLVWG